MSTYKISWVLFLSLLLQCIFPFSGQAGDAGRAPQSITVVADDNYPPYIFRNPDGAIQGILVDEWALWEKKTGIKVILTAMDWSKAQEFMLQGQADVIDTIFFNEKRAELYDFTKPYASIEVPVFFNKNIGGIVDIASLQGLTIGVKAGDACIEVLKKNGITSLKAFSSYEAIIRAAMENQIKVFSIDKPPALYYLYKLNIENEFRHSLTLYTGEFHRAVKKGRADILKVVEDGFALITKKEFEAIHKKWMGEPLLRPEHFLYISFFLLFVGLIFLGLIAFNITLRKKVRSKTAELEKIIHQLGQSEEDLKEARQIAHVGSWRTDLAGRQVVWSDELYKIFGFDPAFPPPPHTEHHSLFTPESWDRLCAAANKTMATGIAYELELEMVRKDGTRGWMWVYGRTILDARGVTTGLRGAVQDITERKRAEEALREKEEKYRRIYDNILDIYYEASLEGIILEVSPSVEKYSRYRREELIGRSVYDIYPDPETRDRLFEMILSKGKVRDYETDFMDKDGTRSLCSLNIELIKDSEGRPEKIVGIFRDISERKKNELERIENQKIADEREKMALVGRIAGKMAHDFNNVLGIIMGNTELSLLDCKDAKTKKTLELIYEQTLRGKNLTRNLVAFSRDQEPKQEFFSIDEKMDLVISLLKKDLEGINVIREYSRNMPELLADPGMMEHAMVNLIQNSIHATSLTPLPEIIIRTYHRDGLMFIEIEDNGCGIPGDSLKEIFEPAFTLKGSNDKNGLYKPGIKGTGYGMPNVKKYIEQHKGRISIHSELKKGTKVVIALPVIKKALTEEEIAEVKKEKISCGKYILLVEDEQAISDIQYRILTHEPLHHRVDIAGNGQVAVDLLNRNTYELISLDYILPGELNGMDVYHRIRETDKTVPILFISGNIEFLESIKDLKQKDPYMDHLSKPCKNIDYISSINKLFESTSI